MILSLHCKQVLPLQLLVPQVDVSSNFRLRHSDCTTTFFLVILFSGEVDIGVARSDHSVVVAEASPLRVVEQGHLFCVRKDAETRGENRLRSADVPHRVARIKVHKEVTLVLGSLDAVGLERHEVLEDVLHDMILHVVQQMASVLSHGLLFDTRVRSYVSR